MADRGFDIEEDLALVDFLKGKQQLSECELVETRCIASLRIHVHVERAMEQLKNLYF